MPVVSGLATKYDYRCDGSNNTGGLQPGEMIAMAAISIANRTYGQTGDDELNLFKLFGGVSEEWLAPIPKEEDHSMILLPYAGVAYYKQSKDAATGEPVFNLIGYEPKDGSALVEIPTPEEGVSIVDFPYAAANSVGIKVTPIGDRENTTKTEFEVLLEKYNDALGEGKTADSAQISELKKSAERITPCVALSLMQLNKNYVHVIDSKVSFAEEEVWSDVKTWTPEKLDTMGFLSVLNTVWPL